jgi:hypothetical protein
VPQERLATNLRQTTQSTPETRKSIEHIYFETAQLKVLFGGRRSRDWFNSEIEDLPHKITDVDCIHFAEIAKIVLPNQLCSSLLHFLHKRACQATAVHTNCCMITSRFMSPSTKK